MDGKKVDGKKMDGKKMDGKKMDGKKMRARTYENISVVIQLNGAGRAVSHGHAESQPAVVRDDNIV